MKKQHQKTLKFHSYYNITLGIIFLTIILIKSDVTLMASMVFLFMYVIGNGIIHTRSNKLEKDSCLEYIILSIVVLVVIISATSR